MEVGDMGGGIKDKIRFLLNTDFALSGVLGLWWGRGAAWWRVPVLSVMEFQSQRELGVSGGWGRGGPGNTVTNQAGAVFLQLPLQLGSWLPRADVVEIVRLHLF